MKNLVGDRISLNMALKESNAYLLRLAAATIASKMDFTIDKIDDIKMALEEAFNLIFRNNNQGKNINIDFTIGSNHLEININDAKIASFDETIEQKYGFFILTGLLDKVDIQPTNNGSFNISLIKNLW